MQPTLLLHVCCAPCMPYVVELLRKEFLLTAFYSNPNIHPREEYQKRLREVRAFSRKIALPLVEDPFLPRKWFAEVEGYEKEKEGGKRCRICYRYRLRRTANKALELKTAYFSTVLSLSPHKDAVLLNQIGKELAQESGVKFYAANFKKKEGFKISMQKSRMLNFYRQKYCGCVYSKGGKT